jgi:hypothetical protein
VSIGSRGGRVEVAGAALAAEPTGAAERAVDVAELEAPAELRSNAPRRSLGSTELLSHATSNNKDPAALTGRSRTTGPNAGVSNLGGLVMPATAAVVLPHRRWGARQRGFSGP